jgi:hypothetical protein
MKLDRLRRLGEQVSAIGNPRVRVAFGHAGIGDPPTERHGVGLPRTPNERQAEESRDLVFRERPATRRLEGHDRLRRPPQRRLRFPKETPRLDVPGFVGRERLEDVQSLRGLAFPDQPLGHDHVRFGCAGREIARLLEQPLGLGGLARRLSGLGRPSVLYGGGFPHASPRHGVGQPRDDRRIRRVELRQAPVRIDQFGRLARPSVVFQDCGHLDLRFADQSLFPIQIGARQIGLGASGVELGDLLVHGDGFDRQAVRPVQFAQLQVLLDGLRRLPRPGVQVPQVVAHRQVARIGLEDGVVLRNRPIPLALLGIGEGVLEDFAFVESHGLDIPSCEKNDCSRYQSRTGVSSGLAAPQRAETLPTTDPDAREASGCAERFSNARSRRDRRTGSPPGVPPPAAPRPSVRRTTRGRPGPRTSRP